MTGKQSIVPRGATLLDRALRRARDRSRLLMRLTSWPPVGRFAGVVLVSRFVREPVRFALRELLGRSIRARYRLRGSGLRIWLRHSTPDVQNFDEIFYQELYAPPRQVIASVAGARVADLGANIGLGGAYFLGHLGAASVLAFEPDPANAEVHELTLEENALADRWRLIRACASVEAGELRFAAGGFAESHVAAEGETGVLDLPAVDVFPHLDDVDVVKIDIEGAEWAILLDRRFGSLPARIVVLEYHAYLCPESDSRALANRLLRSAGYEVEPIFHEPDGTGMVWAWRP